MLVTEESGTQDVWADLDAHTDPTLWRPRLAPDIETAEFPIAGGGAYVMVENPRDLVYFRFTPEEAELLPLLDGEHSIGELVLDRLEEDGDLDLAGVLEIVRLLESGGFLDTPFVDVDAALDRAVHPPTVRSRLSKFVTTLTAEWSGAEQLVRWLYGHGFRHLFTRMGMALAALLTVAGVAAFVDVGGRHDYSLTNRHFGVAFVVLMVLDLAIIFVHELGHALVLVHYGRRVKTAGFRIYFGSPSFFIESSDALMLPRHRRILQSAAGPGLEIIGTSVAAILLWTFPTGAAAQTLYQFVVINYFVLFLNLIPLLELDGYWILSDTLQQPDLRPRSLAFIRHDLWRMLRHRQRLTRRELGLGLYGTLGVAFTIAALGSALFFWRRVFGDTVLSMWQGGWLGRLLLIVLVSFLAGPIIRALITLLQALGRSLRARLHQLRFRFQSRWRVEAAELLDTSGTFGDVPVEVLNDLAGRFQLRSYGRGQAVVRQGDRADAYYLVRSGLLEVIEEPVDGVTVEPRWLREVRMGEGFGETGLLDDAPRNATVRAVERSEVFRLDKGSFDRLLAERADVDDIRPTLQQLAELRSLRPFAHLGSADLSRLAERGRWLNLSPGEILVTEGEVGDSFYVIASGRVDVSIAGEHVRTRGPGEHIGEMALLLDRPRMATVRAATAARVYRLDREAFDALVAGEFRRGDLRTNVSVDRDWDH